MSSAAERRRRCSLGMPAAPANVGGRRILTRRPRPSSSPFRRTFIWHVAVLVAALFLYHDPEHVLVAHAAFLGGGGTKPDPLKGAKPGHLYVGLNDSEPIVDYEAGPDEVDPVRPAFLYGPNTGPRVVEFYAHWCGHCQNFRWQYIEYARRVGQLLNDTVTLRDKNITIPFYAVSCTVHAKICKDFHINAYPRIKAFLPGSSTPEADIYPLIHPFELFDKLHLHDPPASSSTLDINDISTATSSSWTDSILGFLLGRQPVVPVMMTQQQKHQAIFDDAYRSFDYSMRHFVFSDTAGGSPQQTLSNEATQALKDWLLLLSKTMPHQTMYPMQRVTKAILQNLTYNATATIEMMTREQWMTILDQAYQTTTKMTTSSGSGSSRNGVGVPATWSPECTKSGRGGGSNGIEHGYWCGLWRLFHIMTIGVVEWNQHTDSGRRLAVAANEASDILRNYVDHFLKQTPCEECRTLFLKEYDNCEWHRCERLTDDKKLARWRLLSVWLLDMHNSVNVRLWQDGQLPVPGNKGGSAAAVTTTAAVAKDGGIHPAHWPSAADCPKCYQEDGTYDSDIMYKHLRITYWPEDAVSATYREELGEPLPSDQDAKSATERMETGGSYHVPFVRVAVLLLFLALFGRKLLWRRGGGKHVHTKSSSCVGLLSVDKEKKFSE